MKIIKSIENGPQEKERLEENGLIPIKSRENVALMFYDADTKTLMTRKKVEAHTTSLTSRVSLVNARPMSKQGKEKDSS